MKASRKLSKVEFDNLLKVIDIVELQKITMGNRKKEHRNFYKAAIKYGIIEDKK